MPYLSNSSSSVLGTNSNNLSLYCSFSLSYSSL
nr:MAG TPA: hypothetical protein [Caudoviricetes sp.]DAR45831.1 MAG TPA: hypothetical protein [Bacteriophage sp.]